MANRRRRARDPRASELIERLAGTHRSRGGINRLALMAVLQLKRRSLVPIGATTYFALATAAGSAAHQRGLFLLAWPLLAPVVLGFLLTRAERYRNAHRIIGPAGALELLLTGLVLFLIPVSARGDARLSLLTEAIALQVSALGALILLTRVPAPPGFRRVPPRAHARDIQFVMSALWVPATLAALLQLVAPDLVPVSPLALDTAMTFSAMSSLFLLLAAEGRIFVLRGLELGTLDRAKAGIALLLTALLVAVGSVALDVSQADVIAIDCLMVGSVALGITQIAPNPARIARAVRGLMALLLFGVPLAALLALLALRLPERAATLTFVTFAVAALVGVLSAAIARPLRPGSGRLLHSILRAEVAALDPDPDRAMTNVLLALSTAEPRAASRPEVYTANPGRLLWVETGGFVREKPAEFLGETYRLACMEPFAVLRRESLTGAAVRQPEVREILSWFMAHDASVAIALREDDGPVGLLVIPKGERNAWLTFEEAEALGRLGEKLTGLVSIHSALVRSQARDLANRKLLDEARARADAVRSKFDAHAESAIEEAERMALPLSVAGHSPRSIETKRSLDQLKAHGAIVFWTPPGVDPMPWAAYLHLLDPHGQLIIFDALSVDSTGHHRALLTDLPSSAFQRAADGTLLILGAHLLTEANREQLTARLTGPLESARPRRIVFSGPPHSSKAQLGSVHLPSVALPELRDRAEDLQPLIFFELARLGLLVRGEPVGLTRGALRELLDRPFPGNELELRGVLAAQVARADGTTVSRAELLESVRAPEALRSATPASESRTGPPESARPESIRKRARASPRTRY